MFKLIIYAKLPYAKHYKSSNKSCTFIILGQILGRPDSTKKLCNFSKAHFLVLRGFFHVSLWNLFLTSPNNLLFSKP